MSHHREIVCDEQIGEVELLLQVLEEVDDLRLNRDVERRHRFVGDDEVGIDRDRAREADPLALTAGELVRIAARRVGGQSDDLQQLAHARARLASDSPGRGSAAARR